MVNQALREEGGRGAPLEQQDQEEDWELKETGVLPDGLESLVQLARVEKRDPGDGEEKEAFLVK